MDNRLCEEAQTSLEAINKLEKIVQNIPGLKTRRCNEGDHCILIRELRGGNKFNEIMMIMDDIKEGKYGRVIIKEYNGNLKRLKVCVDIKSILKEFNNENCLKNCRIE